MEQDPNKIIDNLSNEWVKDMVNDKKQIAILVEEKRLLEEKVKGLEDENEVLNTMSEHVKKSKSDKSQTDKTK